MSCEIITALIGVGGTLAGTFFGYFLSRPKIKLSFSLQPKAEFNDELSDGCKTKYSDSGYCIYCYNTGNRPFIIENLVLMNKKSTITQCGIITEVINPFSHIIYPLNVQEYDNILYHCGKKQIKKCDILAFEVSGRKYKSQIDLFLPSLQSSTMKEMAGKC